MKQCTQCLQTLPLSEYYTRTNGTPYSHCKPCHRQNTSKQWRDRQRNSLMPTGKAEKYVAHQLNAKGVPTLHIPGWCDLLCMGIVQVEVKTVYYKYPSHVINFTYGQQQSGLHSDLIAIYWETRIYFLEPDTPALYNTNSTLKTSVSINTTGQWTRGTPITISDLYSWETGIARIHTLYKEKCALLKQGVSIDTLLIRKQWGKAI